MGPDPFGRALRDHYLGEREEPLLDRDGSRTREQPIERWYFAPFDGDPFLDSWLRGPLLDMGAGVGRQTLHYQDAFETVAIEVSERLVRTMRERGVEDARLADMFALREAFERDRFRSALAIGTQVCLAGSMSGLKGFLADLAYVTTPDATAVIDSYDPTLAATAETFGYRADPTPGLAHRVYHCEYEGWVGETLLFRVVSPERLREAAIGTGWQVAEVRHHPPAGPVQFRAALTKG